MAKYIPLGRLRLRPSVISYFTLKIQRPQSEREGCLGPGFQGQPVVIQGQEKHPRGGPDAGCLTDTATLSDASLVGWGCLLHLGDQILTMEALWDAHLQE